MLGLRTHEGEKFERFFRIVQAEARKQGGVFFLDSGDGRDFESEDMEGEDLTGFLIPFSLVQEFDRIFQQKGILPLDDLKWSAFYRFAVWERDGDSVTVQFKDFA